MSTWTKAEKNLNDIRDVEKLCKRKSVLIKNDINGFLADFEKYGKVLQFSEPTVGTLAQLFQRNIDTYHAAEKKFIERAKECVVIKSEVKNAVADLEKNFSQAVKWSQRQGLNFD